MTSNTVIESVLSARYYHGNEKNWLDVCKRVSDFVGNNDEERISFYELMKDCDFIPNSPTLFNAGLPNGQLSACFVLPVHDSLSCIFDTLKQCALIFKSGGGVGMSFGEIRPKNSAVGDSNGVASGAVSFMRVYDSAIEAIKAGGKRRGAAMGVLPCDHGDIMEFIACKSKEGVIKNFNLSVMMTKEFMDKVKCKQWGDIVTYTTLDDGTQRAVTVGEVWHGIVEGSHRNGEPAVLFDDNINEANALKQLGKIVSTNPCVTYETAILTDIGYVKIGDVIDKHVNVWNGESWSDVVPFFVAHNQQIYNVTFSNGSVVRCTADHNWFTIKGKKTTLELKIGDKLEKCDYPIVKGERELEDAYTYGFFCGDGAELNVGKNVIYIYSTKKCCFSDLNIDFDKLKSNFKTITVDKTWKKTFVPLANYSITSRKEYLAGLIDADGCATYDGGYQVSSVNKSFLQNVAKMVNTLGVPCKVVLNTNADVKSMPDGKHGCANYYCKAVYRLLISKYYALKLNLPLRRVKKYESIQREAGQFVKVESIILSNKEDVYCLTEPIHHR
ncbi:MAG: ribonucleotide reductase N-terminal alpha domain-containing protein, partial [Candidatus Pacebacteria bacterium]|nr:ribonucleotide reductase N-terminal alpha domain-containing protein [Candidatus Paceibacterota bacterium]